MMIQSCSLCGIEGGAAAITEASIVFLSSVFGSEERGLFSSFLFFHFLGDPRANCNLAKGSMSFPSMELSSQEGLGH